MITLIRVNLKRLAAINTISYRERIINTFDGSTLGAIEPRRKTVPYGAWAPGQGVRGRGGAGNPLVISATTY